MFKYYNAHPQGKMVRDCVKRAFTKALDMEYKQVSLELNRIKKITGCENFNSPKNWREYAKQKGFIKISFPAVAGQPRMNGNRFCQDNPTGTYILQMAGHLTCCKDGIIYDTWNCLDKCVYIAYKLGE
jgi:hypothetical protein